MLLNKIDLNIFLKTKFKMIKESFNLPTGSKIIVTIFLLSGFTHLLSPGVFRTLIPPFLGNGTFWVYLSGLAEIVCAIGILLKTKWAPRLTAFVLIVIWVGNWWYAIEVSFIDETSWVLILGAWLRLPLQIPLIQWALRTPVN
jgi:uncharacterized membrane protein